MIARVSGFACGLGVCTAVVAVLLSPLVPLPWSATADIDFAVGFAVVVLVAWAAPEGPIDLDGDER